MKTERIRPVRPRLGAPGEPDSMIMGSFDRIATETTHDHGELEGRDAALCGRGPGWVSLLVDGPEVSMSRSAAAGDRRSLRWRARRHRRRRSACVRAVGAGAPGFPGLRCIPAG